MKLLIIGGTRFLGRAAVDAALAAGHTVTLFNRGKSNPDLYPQVETITGDRNEDAGALKGRTWDAVIDTCGYFPRAVRTTMQVLAGAVGHYTFISTISVYADTSKPGMAEDGPLAEVEDKTSENVNEHYGALKALCEQAAEEAMPGRVLSIRPGLIVGPHDPTDRYTYWPVRVAQGGEVLAPENPEYKCQVIDVRDLAEWNIRMAEAGVTGIFNATGPEKPFDLGDLLVTCKEVSGSDARFTWVPDEFLVQQEVGPWMELPMWIPDGIPGLGKALMQVSVKKALKNGLTFRPMDAIVRDTLEFARTRPADYQLRAGIAPEKEARVLKAWHERNR
jgi:2'-hydroxyisoflavone reductase